jgi:hypothetical protein
VQCITSASEKNHIVYRVILLCLGHFYIADLETKGWSYGVVGIVGNVTLRLGGWKNPLEQPRKWKVDLYSEVLAKLSRVPCSVENTSVTV